LCQSGRRSGWIAIFCGSIVSCARIEMTTTQSLAQSVLVKIGLPTHDSEYTKRFKSVDQGPYRAIAVEVLVSAILQTHVGVLHCCVAVDVSGSSMVSILRKMSRSKG
jgi:hypothetical protein